ENTWMIRRRHIGAGVANGRLPHAPVRRQQHICRFGRAGGEDDMLRLAVDERRNLASRLIDDLPGSPAFSMHGGRIGGIERFEHSLTRRRKQRRSSVIIEIDAPSRHACFRLASQLVVSGRVISLNSEGKPSYLRDLPVRKYRTTFELFR